MPDEVTQEFEVSGVRVTIDHERQTALLIATTENEPVLMHMTVHALRQLLRRSRRALSAAAAASPPPSASEPR
jgi:hypothetical protein